MGEQCSEPSTASYSSYKRRRINPSSLRILAKASSWDSSIRRDKRRPSILLLPPEIRNQIMEYVLAPGDIYLPAKPPSVVSKARRTLRAADNVEAVVKRIHYPYLYEVVQMYQALQPTKYGCQVLATCKQLYCEGYRIFYERNTFHLAPGPLSASSQYFDNLQAHHRALIKHVAIDTSILDLTPKLVAGLEARLPGGRLDGRSLFTQSQLFTRSVSNWMREIYTSKLEYMQSWNGLADLKLQHRNTFFSQDPAVAISPVFSQGFSIQQQDLKVALDDIGTRIRSGRINDGQLLALETWAFVEVGTSVCTTVNSVGWEVFNEWLQTRASLCIAAVDQDRRSAGHNQVWSKVGDPENILLSLLI